MPETNGQPRTVVINALLLGGTRESGVERCIRALIDALDRYAERPVSVLCHPDAAIEPSPGGRLTRRTVRLPFRSRALRIAWEQLVLPFVIRRLDPDPLLHAPGYIAPLANTVPTVLTVYDLVALRFPRWTATANRWHYRAMLPASIRRAAAIITPSMTVGNEIRQQFQYPAEHIHVIPPPVMPWFFEPPDVAEMEAVRQRYRLPDRFLLCVGNIEPKKNGVGLLNAYAALCRLDPRAVPLVMAGRTAWKSAPFFRRRRDLGLTARVPCLGSVTDRDLRVLYRLADALVMPSWYEGYGLPPLEAMASGTPVVAARGGALPETVGDAADLVDPANADAMAAALQRVRTDAAWRAVLIERGRARVQQHTLRHYAQAHEQVYRRVH